MYEWFIGWRYTRRQRGTRGRNAFVSFISLVSMLGLMLGVAVLIVVLSVMNGFQEELRHRILGVASHIEVTAQSGMLEEWPAVLDRVRRHPEVLGAAPFIQEQAMVSGNGRVQGVGVRGIEPSLERGVAQFADYLRAGSLEALQPHSYGIVLGTDLARRLAVGLGDEVTLIAPTATATLAGVMPRVRAFRVVGLFESGMYEYDSGLVLVHLRDAQALYRYGEAVSGVRLKVRDLFAAPAVVRQLAPTLPAGLWLRDWTQTHANFFRAVQLEKTMMTLILFLIVAVAAFNIVSTLVMAVQDKTADIAILRTLGASPASIMGIFVVQGTTIGVLGLAAGLALGLTIAHHLDVVVPALEHLTGATLWNKEIYFLSELPSKVLAADVLRVLTGSFVLTLLATLYPSWRASRLQPAEALRHE
jgi:lipoprotein-releasing system permease protein